MANEPDEPDESEGQDESTIQVNFGRPIPLFPLDSVVLLPQQVLPLHVFEPRYRQMVEKALDGSGQIAMAVFRGSRWKKEYHGRPPLLPAVCLGQILQHEKLPDGRYNLIVQGVCRAKILAESPPSSERLYREAYLEPVGVNGDEEERLYGVRERLAGLLGEGPLTKFTAAEWVLERINNEEIPTAALLELVSFTMVSDSKLRYRLLQEADAESRADLIESELLHLQRVVRQAEAQHPEAWPKGCSWN
jgi:Lon protease-like protein